MNASVFVTRRIPEPGLELLRSRCSSVEVFEEDRVMTRQELTAAVESCQGLLCLLTDTIDSGIIAAAPALRVISNYAVGYNNIDLDAATARSIMVTNTPGILTAATADHTWALLFSVARRIVEGDLFTRAGKFHGWAPRLMLGADISGRTLGIIGPGRIGTAVAKRAAGFGMNVIYNGSRPGSAIEDACNARRVDLRELLARADFISLHVPLTEKTRHLISTAELSLMKKSAYLINTSRGPVVDEKALVHALKSGDIAGAGLDVFENEPRLEPELITLDSVVLSPHTGSATFETRDNMAVMAAENLLAGLRGGTPAQLVNPAVLEQRP